MTTSMTMKMEEIKVPWKMMKVLERITSRQGATLCFTTEVSIEKSIASSLRLVA
jgi:hypothetical protein